MIDRLPHTAQTGVALLQEFDSVESAQQIMESDLRYQFNLDGAMLRLDYSHAAQPAAAVSASATSDWICPGCSAVNFSRSDLIPMQSLASSQPEAVQCSGPMKHRTVHNTTSIADCMHLNGGHVLICRPFFGINNMSIMCHVKHGACCLGSRKSHQLA